MQEDIRTFLARFTAEELASRNVLVPSSQYGYLLRSRSVDPLIELMGEHRISRLEAPERDWFLTAAFEFCNPLSGEQKSGDAKELSNLGNVFNLQNRHINPFFGSITDHDISDVEPNDSQESLMEPSMGSGVLKFGLERDLQRALRNNINELEPGLKITDNGSEWTVDAGRIDITAEDSEGRIVVIELNAGTALPDSITQLLAYMGTIENDDLKPVRGILVANDFHPRVVQAAQAVPSLILKSYSLQFSFNDRLNG